MEVDDRQQRVIAVGVDGSSASRAAVHWAVTRAVESGERVRLVHIVDGALRVDPAHATMLGDELAFARGLATGIQIDTAAANGDPMTELQDAAGPATLIVVGTHKTGFIRGRAFGSRSLQLAAVASTPIAVIPESSMRSRHGIVVGIGDSPTSQQAVAFAADDAARTGESLVLLRATRRSNAHTDRTELDDEAVAAALLVAKEHGAAANLRVRVVQRFAAESLLDAGTSAKLLVIGSSHGHGRPRAGLGTVVHDVLLNISGPTVVVPAN